MISIKKSVPFLNANLLMATILMVLDGLLYDGSGVNLVQSTALGMTEMSDGFRNALNDRFSLEVYETDIT